MFFSLYTYKKEPSWVGERTIGSIVESCTKFLIKIFLNIKFDSDIEY